MSVSSNINYLESAFNTFNLNAINEHVHTNENQVDETEHSLDYNKDVDPRVLSSNNGGVWRIMALGSRQIAIASYNRLAKIYDVSEDASLNSQERILKGHRKEVLSLAIINENVLATGSSDGTAYFWDINDRSRREAIREKNVTGFYSMALINENTLATGACQRPQRYQKIWEHNIKIWDLSTSTCKTKLTGHKGGIAGMVLLNSQCLASGSGDCTVKIWNLDTYEQVCSLDNHTDYVYGLTKVDENQIASGSKDRSIRLWDVPSSKEISKLSHGNENSIAHASTVYDVKSLNPHILASASRDGYVKVWDTRLQNACIKILDADDGFIYSVDFLQNGNIVAGTSGKQSSKMNTRNTKPQNASVVIWDFQKV